MGFVFGGASLRAYRESLSSFTPLAREEERELAQRWRDGDRKAGDKIIEACLPFVIAVALEYRRWGVPLEDIIQQGNLGLLRAAAKFDPSKDCRLATYAVYWIRAEIREYVVRTYRVVRLGTTKGERRALRAYRTTKETDAAKLAEISGLELKRVEMLLPLLAGREVSLDGSSDESGPIDRLASNEPTPEDETRTRQLRRRSEEAVNAALEGLSEREQFIVRERMMSDDPLTLQRLGELLGVSKERVRQIEERAASKLRARLDDLRSIL